MYWIIGSPVCSVNLDTSSPLGTLLRRSSRERYCGVFQYTGRWRMKHYILLRIFPIKLLEKLRNALYRKKSGEKKRKA